MNPEGREIGPDARDVGSPPAGDLKWQEGDLGYGVAQPVPVDANPQVASVAEAFRTGKYPERTSVAVMPPPFDSEAYQVNPTKYLNTIEPGRVWQSRQPGPDVPHFIAKSDRFLSAEQGEPIVLRTKAIPGAPVTYTSFDLGTFQNQLTSITVAADAEGIARATFTGASGTAGIVNVLAASPLTSGQAHFVLHIHMPRRESSSQAKR